MFIHSWRWFGPDDPVTLEQVVQTGAKNIVSALHQIPVGAIWPENEILQRKSMIKQAGFTWDVVESVPVHEDIKKRTGQYLKYIENFKKTLKNLGKHGITTVCYNFIPALDWSRTNLATKNRDGSEVSSFNFVQFAAIDIHILKRPGAPDAYTPAQQEQARTYYMNLSSRERKELERTFLLGFPGSGESFSLKEVLQRIEGYAGMDRNAYMANLKQFLREIVPVAEQEGVLLAIHPDDPPWPLMGMPRAVSTLQDALEIIQTVDSPSNGFTFCTGSFGAATSNDLPAMVRELSHRINFLHIRNVFRDEQQNFRETNVMEGDVDIHQILKSMVLEDLERSRTRPGYQGIPLRPDHGAKILGDFQETHYPGYSLYGRLKNLAEIRGLEYGIRKNLEDA